MSTPYPLKKFSTLLENVLTPPENFLCNHPEYLSKPLNNSQPPGIFLNAPENFTHTLKNSQPPLIFLNPPPPRKKSQPLPNIILTPPPPRKKSQPLPNIISTLLENLNHSRKNLNPCQKKS